MKFLKYKIIFLFSIAVFFGFNFVNAEVVNVDANKLVSKVDISLSPRSGTFVEGSTFQVPILINTRGKSVNGIEVRINFNKDKLMIVNPSGGTSIIGVWVEPPTYDNTRGTATYVGVVPSGITTEAGMVGLITFKVKSTGLAVVSINSNSKILLNDGLGTSANLDLGRAEYTLLSKPPEGVKIFSETHPIQESWYNNNNAIVSWEKDFGVIGFSFVLDDKPNTIPDNIVDSEDTTKTFDKLDDGLWYFHIKAKKGEAWGNTGHFLFRIDTNPPARFTPEANYLVASTILVERTLVSFFTTDNLSGIDHYEVGVIDKDQPLTKSPVFVQAESPFQVPLNSGGKLQVIVRALDKAGNVRDESLDVHAPFVISKFVTDYLVYILLGIIILGIVILVSHYMFGHHIIRHLKKAFTMKDDEDEVRTNNDVNNQT